MDRPTIWGHIGGLPPRPIATRVPSWTLCLGAKMTFEDLRRRRARQDFALALLVACALFGRHYGIEDLFAYVPNDAYQSLADAFRAGRLSVVSDADHIVVDTAPAGDDAHVVWGPFPAVVYAVLDTVFSAIGAPPFPKAALFFGLAVVHLFLVLVLARRFLGDRTWVPRLAMACYAFSYPFWFAAHEETRVNWVSILASSTLFLAGLLFFARASSESSRSGHWFWSALFLALAVLTRAVYGLHLGVVAIAALTVRPWTRRHAVFLGVSAAGVLLFFAYNHARFKDPLMFGDALIYQSTWDEEATAKGVLPADPLRTLARWGEAAFAFAGLPRPPWSDAIDTLYRYHQTYILILVLPTLVALAAAVPLWKRTARAHRLEWTTLCAGIVPLLLYLLWADEFEVRYQMDYVPLLFLAGLQGASDAAGARVRWLAAPAALVVALSSVGLHFALADRVIAEHGVDPPLVSRYPHRMDRQVPGMWFFSGHPVGRSIRCEAIPTVHTSPADLPVRQESLDRLGIFRFPGDRCEMVFFSGGTLRLDPDRDCRIELYLDADDIEDCGRVALYRDGRPAGRLAEARTDRGGQRLCVFPLGVTGERLVQAYFRFDPVPLRSRDWLRTTPRTGMTELRARCGEP